MTTLTTKIRNRRIDVPAPSDIPDGTEVTLTIAENDDCAPLREEEITRVLAAMQKLERWNIPADVASDHEDWERKIYQHGVEYRDPSTEDVFR